MPQVVLFVQSGLLLRRRCHKSLHELQEVDVHVNEANGSNINEMQGEEVHPIEADGTELYELASDSSSISGENSSSTSEE